ncbi:MAG: hypothetical protein MZU79_01785 [Anaerotruncus sp.]|nr:hypothetical protein [Anaerotruncus sp.]
MERLVGSGLSSTISTPDCRASQESPAAGQTSMLVPTTRRRSAQFPAS